jgi:glutamine synthetase type III
MDASELKKELRRLQRESARQHERVTRAGKIESDNWIKETESWRTTPMTKEMDEFNEIARRTLDKERGN